MIEQVPGTIIYEPVLSAGQGHTKVSLTSCTIYQSCSRDFAAAVSHMVDRSMRLHDGRADAVKQSHSPPSGSDTLPYPRVKDPASRHSKPCT